MFSAISHKLSKLQTCLIRQNKVWNLNKWIYFIKINVKMARNGRKMVRNQSQILGISLYIYIVLVIHTWKFWILGKAFFNNGNPQSATHWAYLLKSDSLKFQKNEWNGKLIVPVLGLVCSKFINIMLRIES